MTTPIKAVAIAEELKEAAEAGQREGEKPVAPNPNSKRGTQPRPPVVRDVPR